MNVRQSFCFPATRTSLARIFGFCLGTLSVNEIRQRNWDRAIPAGFAFIVLCCEWNAWRNVAYLTMKQGLNDNREWDLVPMLRENEFNRIKNTKRICAQYREFYHCCYAGFKPYDKEISWRRIRDRLVLVTRFRHWMASAFSDTLGNPWWVSLSD